MRINTDHNTMDMEARDTNYWLQAYLLQYLFATKAEDPVKVVVPMFPSVPHPRKPGVQIPVEWIEPDSPVAVDIAEDGKDIPEAIVEEVKEDEESVGGSEGVVIEPSVKDSESIPVAENTADKLSPAKQALENLKKEKETSPPAEERKPKMPPSGDLGSGHPDDMSSRDTGFDKKIARDLKPEAAVDESKELPVEIEKPKDE